MMNPFDPKSVLLARHAQHVVLIHFPIALFLSGFAFDVAATWKRASTLESVAYYNVILAGVAAVPTVLTGILAWRWQLEGRRLHGVLLLHLLFASAAAALILVAGYLHRVGRRTSDQSWRSLRIGVEFVASVTIMIAAHLGGFVSGINSTF